MTMRYAHVGQTELASAVAALDRKNGTSVAQNENARLDGSQPGDSTRLWKAGRSPMRATEYPFRKSKAVGKSLNFPTAGVQVSKYLLYSWS